MCALTFSGFPATAVAAGEEAATKRAAPAAKKAPKKNTIPKKYAAQILREHDAYIEAFVNAEMGARYYCKRIYDAIYRGKKTPSQEELDAMAYEVTRLRKELSSVAKRYALNIRVAKRMAVSFMNEEERTLLAEALSFLFATPAYAAPFNLSSLDGIEAGLNSIADGTPDINMPAAEIDRLRKERIERKKAHIAAMERQREEEARNPERRREQIKAEMRAAQSEADFQGTLGYVARGGEIVAAGTVVVAGAALFILSLPATVAAIEAGSTVAAVSTFVGGFVGGGLKSVDSTLGFLDVVNDTDLHKEDRKNLKKITVALDTVNVAVGVLTVESAGEVLEVTLDATELSSDFEEILDSSEDPKAPGRKGAKAVKRAAESASDAKRENKDNGGHDGCGH